MLLIAVLDVLVVSAILFIALRRGLEAALPFFVFALILLPVESKVHIPGLFDFTTARIAIITFAALYFVLPKQHELTPSRGIPLKLLIWITIAWGLVATAHSLVFTTSLKAVLGQLFDFYLVYFLIFKTITKVETVDKILLAVVAAMGVCCVFGVMEAYSGWGVIDLFPPLPGQDSDSGLMMDSERGLRVRATFRHPILFGGALAIVIPIALHLLTKAETRKQKTLLWASVSIMFLNLYKTGSRGPWLGMILAYCLMLLFAATKRRYLGYIALLTVSVLLLRPGIWGTLTSTYTATMNPETSEGISYQGRYELIRLVTSALGRSSSRELWGYGPESFPELHLPTVNAEGHVGEAQSCDNSWLALAVETGYPGMLLVAAIFGTALFHVGRQFFKADEPEKYLYGLVIVNILTFGFLMLSVAIYGWGQQSYLLWISIGVGLVYPLLTAKETKANKRLLRKRKLKPAKLIEEYSC